MKTGLYKKILGCLGMVAIGDALGMPSHDMTREQIESHFNGPLSQFRPPPEDSRVHQGFRAGQVTDDTLLTLSVAKAYIKNRGRISARIIAEETDRLVRRYSDMGLLKMFGPSTRASVEYLRKGYDPERMFSYDTHPTSGASNGGAMKISPVGLIHPGDINGVLDDTFKVCLPSHGTQTGIAAASAIAAGVSEAMNPDADLFSVVRAAIKGAEKGEELGMKKARTVPLPSLPERIRLAVSLALRASDCDEANSLFAKIIGTGLPAYESVPTAIGIFVACGGDPRQAVISGANVGYDTDTIASMAGALAGALKGLDAVPADLLMEVQEVNDLDLGHIAGRLEDLARVA